MLAGFGRVGVIALALCAVMVTLPNQASALERGNYADNHEFPLYEPSDMTAEEAQGLAHYLNYGNPEEVAGFAPSAREAYRSFARYWAQGGAYGDWRKRQAQAERMKWLASTGRARMLVVGSTVLSGASAFLVGWKIGDAAYSKFFEEHVTFQQTGSFVGTVPVVADQPCTGVADCYLFYKGDSVVSYDVNATGHSVYGTQLVGGGGGGCGDKFYYWTNGWTGGYVCSLGDVEYVVRGYNATTFYGAWALNPSGVPERTYRPVAVPSNYTLEEKEVAPTTLPPGYAPQPIPWPGSPFDTMTGNITATDVMNAGSSTRFGTLAKTIEDWLEEQGKKKPVVTPPTPTNPPPVAPPVADGTCTQWVKPSINIAPLNVPVFDAFPFGIPYTLYNVLASLQASPVVPNFSFELWGEDVTVELSAFSSIAAIGRGVLALIFFVGCCFMFYGFAAGRGSE